MVVFLLILILLAICGINPIQAFVLAIGLGMIVAYLWLCLVFPPALLAIPIIWFLCYLRKRFGL